MKPTGPVGAFGVKATAERVAVRVTDALRFDGPVLVTVTVGVSFETDWLNEAEGLPLKLRSPA
jgi:hypothetical protein